MNRATTILLTLAALTPATVHAADPPPDTLVERLTRLAAAPSQPISLDAGDVSHVQIWTPDSPVCGMRAYHDGRILHARGTQARRSRHGADALQPLFAAALELARECPHTSDTPDLLFRVGVEGERSVHGLSSQSACPRAAALAREALTLLGSPLPEAPAQTPAPEQAREPAQQDQPTALPAPLTVPELPGAPPLFETPPHDPVPQIDTSPAAPADLDAALLQLSDPDPNARLASARAIRALAQQAPEEVARRALNPLLSSHDPRVRAEGIEVLADYDGSPQALGPVLSWQADSLHAEVVAAVEARQAFDAQPEPVLPDSAGKTDETASDETTGDETASDELAGAAASDEPPSDEPASDETINDGDQVAQSEASQSSPQEPAMAETLEELDFVVQDQDGSQQAGLVREPSTHPTQVRCVIHADRPPQQRRTLRVRRTAPSGAVIGGLRYGDVVEVTGPPQNGFYPIRFQGRDAWVSAEPRYTQPLD